jgi:hypothetical protein
MADNSAWRTNIGNMSFGSSIAHDRASASFSFIDPFEKGDPEQIFEIQSHVAKEIYKVRYEKLFFLLLFISYVSFANLGSKQERWHVGCVENHSVYFGYRPFVFS